MSQLDQPVDAGAIDEIFQLVLGRSIGNEQHVAKILNDGLSIRHLLSGLLNSEEMHIKWQRSVGSRAASIPSNDFIVPKHLAASGFLPKKVLIVGSCAVDRLIHHSQIRLPQSEIIYIPFNNGMRLPELPQDYRGEIDFQIVQIPQRGLLPDGSYIGTPIDEETSLGRFSRAKKILKDHIGKALYYTETLGIETYVMNLLPPQQNPVGRLEARYDLRNNCFFIEELNKFIAAEISSYSACHLLDVAQIASIIGRQSIQDDSVSHVVHGSMLVGIGLTEEDSNRLDWPGDTSILYGDRICEYSNAIIDTALACHKSLRFIDAIKLVVFDLDDTLWRGVAAEKVDKIDPLMIEGWPLGILEAAYYLAERGILIAIASKNDYEVVREIWHKLYGKLMPLSRFVSTRINWNSKVSNILEIIAETNIGADAVLFIDDNPKERAQVKEGIPGIRTLDCPLAEWRRSLLWSPELQPASINAEGKNRTISLQNKVQRDKDKMSVGEDVFLSRLDLRIGAVLVDHVGHPSFDRCLDLTNKTNQYNTTGKRWSKSDLSAFLSEGGKAIAFEVEDRYSSYGITALALVKINEIVQYVMSCRVFGLGVEAAALATVCEMVQKSGCPDVYGFASPTGKNALALTFFEGGGFVHQENGRWRLASSILPPMPQHVNVGMSGPKLEGNNQYPHLGTSRFSSEPVS